MEIRKQELMLKNSGHRTTKLDIRKNSMRYLVVSFVTISKLFITSKRDFIRHAFPILALQITNLKKLRLEVVNSIVDVNVPKFSLLVPVHG